MARVRQRDTKPEMIVRRLLHGAGYRYRLHVGHLPGHPDIVMPKYRTVVFVHGCFWHRHAGCPRATTPKTNPTFWQQKFADNVQRDRRVRAELEELGWNVVTVWECQTTDLDSLAAYLLPQIPDDRR